MRMQAQFIRYLGADVHRSKFTHAHAACKPTPNHTALGRASSCATPVRPCACRAIAGMLTCAARKLLVGHAEVIT